MNKPGKCPVPTYYNAGGDCQQDSECAGSMKCCPHTLAGFACMEPDSSTDVAGGRPGDCPVIMDSKTGIGCERDMDCMEPQICCDYGQASICVYPTVVDTLPKYKEPVLKPGLDGLGHRLAATNRWLIQQLKSKARKIKIEPKKSNKLNPRIQKLLSKISSKKSEQHKIFQKLTNFINWFLSQKPKPLALTPKKIKNLEILRSTSAKPRDVTTAPTVSKQPGGVPIVPSSKIANPKKVKKTLGKGLEVNNSPSSILISMNVLPETLSTDSPKSVIPEIPVIGVMEAPILPPLSEPEAFPDISMLFPEPEILVPEPELPTLPTTTVPVLSSSSTLNFISTTTSSPMSQASTESPRPESDVTDSSLPEGLSLPEFKPIWHIIDPMSKQKIPLGKLPIVDAISPAERMYENEYGPPADPSDASQTSFDNHFVSYLQKTMVPPESNSIYPLNSLLYPEVEVFKPEKQGSCPANLMYRQCETNCTTDDDCPGVDKCCDMGCGNVCVTPKEKKIY